MHETIVSIKLALKNLKSNLGRTVLSLLGIVIGVMSVVIIMSFGAGIQDFVINQVESFGTNLIEVEVKSPQTKHASTQNAINQVGGAQITTLKLKELEEAGKLPNVGDWYGGIMSQQYTSYREQKKQAILMGVTAGIWKVDEQVKIDQGRFFSDKEDRGLAQIVVIGSKLKEKFFPNQEALGKNIKIKGQTFRVIGTLKERGSTGFFNFDEIIYLPVRTLQKKIMGIDHTQFAFYKLKDPEKTDLTVKTITDYFRREHETANATDDDFGVMSIAEATKMVSKVFDAVNILLLALTSISLVVGGVGIMNVMYVSVSERTSEIGLRKSLGAKNSDILKQFLFEGIFITILGGIIGIILGATVAKIAEIISARFGFLLNFPITFSMVALGFGFSALVGLLFGVRPAYKASRLTPMEALLKK